MEFSTRGKVRLVFACIVIISCRQKCAVNGFAPTATISPILSKPKVSLASIPSYLQESIGSVAISLWGPEELQNVIAGGANRNENDNDYIDGRVLSGEATWESDNNQLVSYLDRRAIFEKRALEGDARAQHSLGLLLWNGYCGGARTINDIESARWHAAAAVQHHLDAMAVLGGCLRTGTGVALNEKLGLALISYAANQDNPSGVNKQAALEEAAGNAKQAFALYQSCPEPNALLFMNLGWAYMEGEGAPKDCQMGIDNWKAAVALAPDEGSEEAAWFLYQHYHRGDPKEAQKWLTISASLGYPEALDEV